MRHSSRHGSKNPDHALRQDLERLVSLLVDEPDDVEVSERQDRGRTCFEIWVADDDLGKVIGRQGRTARALRALLEARGESAGRRYALEICE